MEGILLMVVLFIISSLFSNKKPNDKSQMPPFNNKPTSQNFELDDTPQQPSNTKRTLEDFAKEIFEQINEKTAIPTTQTPIEQTQEIERPVEKIQTYTRPVFDADRSSRIKENEKEKSRKDPIKNSEIGRIVPTTRNALVQAIITSEILGPPKAKRR